MRLDVWVGCVGGNNIKREKRELPRVFLGTKKSMRDHFHKNGGLQSPRPWLDKIKMAKKEKERGKISVEVEDKYFKNCTKEGRESVDNLVCVCKKCTDLIIEKR